MELVRERSVVELMRGGCRWSWGERGLLMELGRAGSVDGAGESGVC